MNVYLRACLMLVIFGLGLFALALLLTEFSQADEPGAFQAKMYEFNRPSERVQVYISSTNELSVRLDGHLLGSRSSFCQPVSIDKVLADREKSILIRQRIAKRRAELAHAAEDQDETRTHD